MDSGVGGGLEPATNLKGEVWPRPRLKEGVRILLESMIDTKFTMGVDRSLTILVPSEANLPPSALVSVPFVHTRCAGETVLLDPAPNQLGRMLRYWKTQRDLNPYESEAVAMVPRWDGGSAWRKELGGWRLLHEFPPGQVMYEEKTDSAQNPRDCPVLEYAVQAWYCPPDDLPDGFEGVLPGRTMDQGSVMTPRPAKCRLNGELLSSRPMDLPGVAVQAWSRADDGPRLRTVSLRLSTLTSQCVGSCDCQCNMERGGVLATLKGAEKVVKCPRSLSVRELARRGERNRRDEAALLLAEVNAVTVEAEPAVDPLVAACENDVTPAQGPTMSPPAHDPVPTGAAMPASLLLSTLSIPADTNLCASPTLGQPEMQVQSVTQSVTQSVMQVQSVTQSVTQSVESETGAMTETPLDLVSAVPELNILTNEQLLAPPEGEVTMPTTQPEAAGQSGSQPKVPEDRRTTENEERSVTDVRRYHAGRLAEEMIQGGEQPIVIDAPPHRVSLDGSRTQPPAARSERHTRAITPEDTPLPHTDEDPMSLTMSFKGTVGGQMCRILVDTGASDSFVTKRVADYIGVKIGRVKIAPVEMGGGESTQVLGRIECRLIIQEHRSTTKFFVLSELAGYDAIVGQDWLKAHEVALCYKGQGRCTVRKGPGRIVLSTWAEMSLKEGVDMWGDATPPVKNPPNLLHLRRKMEDGPRVKKVRFSPLPTIPEHASASGPEVFRGVNVISGRLDSAGRVKLNIITRRQYERAQRKGCRTFEVLVRPQLNVTVSGQELPADIHPGIAALLIKYPESVMDIPAELPPMRHTAHTIPIQPGEGPVYRPMYRLSPKEKVEVEKHVAELLRRGWIVPSVSPWGAPILFVTKSDGSLRLVVDYRGANSVTVKNRYPLPRIDDLLDKLHGAKHFTSLDLQSGYNQIRISEEDVPKTAFNTHIGHYEFKVLSFGLSNGPSCFQNLMNDVLGPVLGKYCLVYMDDILIYSQNMEDHLVHVEAVLKLLVENKLYAKLSKCKWAQSSTKFLGHEICAEGIKVDPRKVEVVRDWPTPTNATELRSFIGLATYFRKFIQSFSLLTHPLHGLLRTKEPVPEWVWTQECQKSFDAIKQGLITAPVLACPDFSEGAAEFEVICDASLVAVGAILVQGGRPIAYESRALIPAEKNYTAGEIELLAVIHAMKTWRCYLEGVKCRIVTDHCPLRYLKTQPNLSRRQTRWSEYLQMYDFEWEYRPGKTNPADPLSRLAVSAATEEVSDREATLLALSKFQRVTKQRTTTEGLGFVEGSQDSRQPTVQGQPVRFVVAQEKVATENKTVQMALPRKPVNEEVERTMRALGYVKRLLKMNIQWSVKVPRVAFKGGAAVPPPDYASMNLRGEIQELSDRALRKQAMEAQRSMVQKADTTEVDGPELYEAFRKVLALGTGEQRVPSARIAARKFRFEEEETKERLLKEEELLAQLAQEPDKTLVPRRPKTRVHGGSQPPLTFEEVRAEPETAPGRSIGDVLERCRLGYKNDAWFQDEANLMDLMHGDNGLYTRNGATVVPDAPELREDILEEIHNTTFGGHLGGQRTFEQVCRMFWWPGHRDQVLRHVQKCVSCQTNKTGHRLPTGMLQGLPITERRWESVSLDFITGLPLSQGGNTQIVVFIDRLTKMTHIAALRENASAMDVVRVFRREVFRLHGLPRNLVSDRDAKFTSQLWQDIFKLLGTKVNMTTAYHPQGDGQVENMNQTLENMLRAWVNANLDNWDELLDCAEFAINNAYNASVKNTPFRLNYGQNPLTPLGMLAESKVVGALEFATEVRDGITLATQLIEKVYAADLAEGRTVVGDREVDARRFKEEMWQSMEAAKVALEKAQARQKQSFDEHHRHQEFEVGDRVLLRTTNLNFKGPNAKKLLPKWIGPFTVDRKFSELTYRLNLPACMRAHPSFHTSLLKPYFENERSPPPIPMEEEDYPIFTVEAMLEMKEVKGKASAQDKLQLKSTRPRYSYLVKWEGYGREHNSWEPEASFTGRPGCLKLIDQLKESVKDRKS